MGANGKLCLDGRNIREFTRLVPAFLSIVHRTDPGRRQVERLIEETYARRYGSRIAQHYPVLMGVHDSCGTVLAAIGFRAAAEEPLFLEQYLQCPVEVSLSRSFRAEIDRDAIVEIGSLASAGGGASAFLFVALAAYLKQRDYRFAVVTATRAVRRAFDTFRFDTIRLGNADPSTLADAGRSWGDYYAHRPEVLAGAIAPCLAHLERFLPEAHNADLGSVFSRRADPALVAAE